MSLHLELPLKKKSPILGVIAFYFFYAFSFLSSLLIWLVTKEIVGDTIHYTTSKIFMK